MDDDRPLVWVGTTLDDISAFPDDVKQVMGFALRVAQRGGKHPRAKPLKGYKGAGVLEVVDDFDGDTYRAVYTVMFPGAVYGLHAFQKKSKSGKETSKTDLKMIERRLRAAESDHAARNQARKNNG
ncbi:MAG: type II toxin-antitoxin system RelE/ParE family toxin [Sphingomicrobium sp.]